MATFPVPILGDGRPPKISDHFGAPRSGGPHGGSDIMYERPEKGEILLPTLARRFEMPDGVPALAFMAGKVTRSGVIGTGGRVQIDHGAGLTTKYFHMRNLRVREGDRVEEADPVGTISHNPTGFKLNHLHFEMFKNGRRINPEPFLANSAQVPIPGVHPLVKAAIIVGVGLWASKYVLK